MNRILSEPSWGVQILQDTETGEVSVQCVCGGVGMYYRRLLLSSEEARALAAGHLSIDALVSDICKEAPAIRERLVPTLEASVIGTSPGARSG